MNKKQKSVQKISLLHGQIKKTAKSRKNTDKYLKITEKFKICSKMRFLNRKKIILKSVFNKILTERNFYCTLCTNMFKPIADEKKIKKF